MLKTFKIGILFFALILPLWVYAQIADDQVPVGNASDRIGFQSVPNCTDTGGNHLNYTASSNAFSCGTSGGGTTIATATALVPQPTGTTVGQTVKGITVNTTQFFSAFVLTGPITTDNITIRTGTVTTAGTVDLTLYSQDCQTQYFSVTTASLGSANTNFTTAITPVALNPGIYYLGINGNGTISVQVQVWDIALIGFISTQYVTSEPRGQGSVTISADTPAATCDPTALTDLGNDNVGVLFMIAD